MKRTLLDPLCCNILFPIHGNEHWSLLELVVGECTWNHYDSLHLTTRSKTCRSGHTKFVINVVSKNTQKVKKINVFIFILIFLHCLQKSAVNNLNKELQEEGHKTILRKNSVLKNVDCAQQSNG